MVCIGDDKYYNFYTPTIFDTVISTIYKGMVVEAPNPNFMYYKDQPRSYNYDQITGQETNVFSKDNINPKLEATDGWGEKDGICYFRATAQSEPVLLNGQILNYNNLLDFLQSLGLKLIM